MTSRALGRFVLLLWLAFVVRGTVHALLAPMWDGFDEPFHAAYIGFVAEHGRPPGYKEPSFPKLYLDANRLLPSMVGHGAPTFAEWRRFDAATRAHDRAAAAQLTRGRGLGGEFVGENYERQHGPLFYYLAAPLYLATKACALPVQVVILRLFCTLLASLVVPVGARLLRMVGGESMLLAGLPIIALAPNTPFAVIRVSNEALAWPLFALSLLGSASLVVRPSIRDAVLTGVAIAAAVWTRMSAVVLLAGPMVAGAVALRQRRPERWRPAAAALGIPMIATAILAAWNHAASGSWSGLVQQSALGRPSLADVSAALQRMRTLPLGRELVKNHLWCGGWGFVKPDDATYAVLGGVLLLGFAACALVAMRRKRFDPPGAPLLPLIAVAAAYLAAMFVHMLTGAIAAIRIPGFPTIGAEGWYLDELRLVEATAIAFVIARAFGVRGVFRAAAIFSAVLLAIDLSGLSMLMLPQWSGGDGLAGAVNAAPTVIAPSVVVGLLATYVIAAILALVNARAPIETERGHRTR